MKQEKPSRPGPGRPPTIDDPVRTICDAAAALIAAKGYDNTSLQDVAAAVGVTKAGLYHYFPTKQALYDAIVKSALDEMFEATSRAVDAAGGHDQKLLAFMSAHATYFETHRDKYRASFFGRGGLADDFTADQLAARRAYAGLLEGLLEEAVRAGAFSIADIPTFARGILGMLNWMARWYSPDGPQTATEIAVSYGKTLISGVAPR